MLRAIIIIVNIVVATSVFTQSKDIPNSKQVEVSSLEDAYQKELIFLRKEKRLLKERLIRQKSTYETDIKKLNTEITLLQTQQLSLKQTSNQLEKEVTKVQKEVADFDDQKQNLEMTLLQSNDTLTYHNFPIAENSLGFIEKLRFNYRQAIQALRTLNEVRSVNEEFFLKDGRKTTGQVTYIGQIGAFAESEQGSGALAPAGKGRLKVWADENGKTIAPLSQQKGDSLEMFLFDSLEKDQTPPEPKRLMETLKNGGSIGWVITILGIVAIIAIIIRALILRNFQSNHKIAEKQLNNNSKNADDLFNVVSKLKGGSARLVELALMNIHSQKFEDIIAEGYIEQTKKLDRFNTFILVVSAVAPLLGLLGTVTGMIATFDIITEVGTGDPKLLSSGISEALITTMFGLIVAIPALLVGNLLSSWAEKLKTDLEKMILNISNRFDHAA